MAKRLNKQVRNSKEYFNRPFKQILSYQTSNVRIKILRRAFSRDTSNYIECIILDMSKIESSIKCIVEDIKRAMDAYHVPISRIAVGALNKQGHPIILTYEYLYIACLLNGVVSEKDYSLKDFLIRIRGGINMKYIMDTNSDYYKEIESIAQKEGITKDEVIDRILKKGVLIEKDDLVAVDPKLFNITLKTLDRNKESDGFKVDYRTTQRNCVKSRFISLFKKGTSD